MQNTKTLNNIRVKAYLFLPVFFMLLSSLVACRDRGKHGQDGISMRATHDVQGAIRLQRSHPLETVVRITFVDAHDGFAYDDIIWQVLFGGREFTEIVYGSLPVVPADSKLGPRQNAPAIGESHEHSNRERRLNCG